MEDRETPRMRKYGESNTTRIMMATVPHVTSGSGLRKFQADLFLLDRVYMKLTTAEIRHVWSCTSSSARVDVACSLLKGSENFIFFPSPLLKHVLSRLHTAPCNHSSFSCQY